MMNNRLRNTILLMALVVISVPSLGQSDRLQYYRPLEFSDSGWFEVPVGMEIRKKSHYKLHDLRILALDSPIGNGLPYLLQRKTAKQHRKYVSQRVINPGRQGNRYFFTIESKPGKLANSLLLSFKQKSFDWLLKLEGSQNQQDWQLIADSQRVLRLKIGEEVLSHQQIDFPDCRYRFYRLSMSSASRPQLQDAQLLQVGEIPGDYEEIAFAKQVKEENTEEASTTFYFQTEFELMPDIFRLSVDSDFDYYRPYLLYYLADSNKVKDGWTKNWSLLSKGYLRSDQVSHLKLERRLSKEWKMTVQNDNNQPLRLGRCSLAVAKVYLHAKLSGTAISDAGYGLYYGNHEASRLSYDLKFFMNMRPDTIPLVIPGPEKTNDAYQQIEADADEGFDLNQVWVWVLLCTLIGLMGWFSFRLLK